MIGIPCLLTYIYQIIASSFSIGTKEAEARIGYLCDGVRRNTKTNALYHFYFALRMIITVSVLVFLDEFPYFQCVILLWLTFGWKLYLISCKPLLTYKMELFNEVCIYSSTHIAMIMLVKTSVNTWNMLGWGLIGFSSLNVTVNVGVLIISQLMLIVDKYKSMKALKNSN